MADVTLGVDLQLKGLSKFRGGVRSVDGDLRKLSARGRDASGRFTGGAGAGTYRDASGRLRGPGGRFVGDGSGGSGGSGRGGVGRDVSRFGRGMQSFGMGTTIAGLGTGYALKRLTQPVLDYEKAIVDAVAVTGDAVGDASGQNEKRLRDLTRQFTHMGYAADEVAQAVGFMGMAGMRTDQIMGSMAPTLNLAKAASLDLARTTDLSTDIMTAFALKSGSVAESHQSMTRVADVMTHTFTSSNTTLSLASQSLFKVGNLAVQAGLSLETVAGAVGQLGSAGIKGTEAGTAIRNMLLRVTNPTKAVRESFQMLRLDIDDVTNAIANDDLPRALKMLDDAMGKKNLTNAQRLKVFGTVFGTRAASAGAYLTTQAANGSLEQQIANTRNSGGETNTIASRKLKSDAAKAAAMTAELQQMQIDLGTKVLPGLLPAAREIIESLKEVAAYAEKNPQLVAFAAKWLALLAATAVVGGPAITAIGGLVRVTGGMMSMARVGATGVSAASSALGAAGANGAAAAAGVSKFRNAAGAAPLWISAGAAAFTLGYNVGNLIDDFTGLSSKISGFDIPTLTERLLGLNTERTDKRGAAGLTAEEQAKMDKIDAELAVLDKREKGSDTAKAIAGSFGVPASAMIDTDGAREKRLLAEKRGMVEAARVRGESEKAAREKWTPKITERAQELNKVSRGIQEDLNKLRGRRGVKFDEKGRVELGRGASRKTRADYKDIVLRKAKLESENEITQMKVEKLGLGLKKGDSWKTMGNVKFSPIDVRVTDDRITVNPDAGDFTLGL